ITPNMDALAARGMLFNKAYCQQSLCSPSRTSIMTGVFPETSGAEANNARDISFTKTVCEQWLTFPKYLKENGYNTCTIGKIYHDNSDNPEDWTEKIYRSAPKYMNPVTWENIEKRKKLADKNRETLSISEYERMTFGPAAECYDTDDMSYEDGQRCLGAIELLDKYAAQDKPFLLAVGFTRPHLPFVAPKKYWDLYDRDKISVPSREEPVGVAPYALVPSWYDMRNYSDIPRDGDLDDDKTREMRHAYFACVSYVDALVGKLMTELEQLGLADNTLIMLWGDHGWKLGEYGDWAKFTNMEFDARAPLIVAGPGVQSGTKTDALVDLIDMYPTLCESVGLPVPPHVEGVSFLPVLKNPQTAWRKAAYTIFDRGIDGKVVSMGRSVRTQRYRYTEWRDPETEKLQARELYDHGTSMLATVNLAGNPEYSSIVNDHARLLAAGPAGMNPEKSEKQNQ
ncbi:MAG: sulfatase, partial [Kiritimatiellales bacterium]